jgi:hypothetical protein
MEDLIELYLSWLKQKINYEEINGYYEITTPFVNHINDYIQFYLRRDEKDNIYMTDDGETLSSLKMVGLNVYLSSRKREIEEILNDYSVKLKGNEIITITTLPAFPMTCHKFIQAILAVDSLYIR